MAVRISVTEYGVRELHEKAMKLAQDAMIARHKGEYDHASTLAREAYLFELQAVGLVPEEQTSEPTLSILYRSAASLALQCGEFQESLRLIAKGLSGYPPPGIEKDLRDLYEQLDFEQYLIEREIVLEDAELELSMRGKETDRCPQCGTIHVKLVEERDRLQRAIDAVPDWVWLSQPGPEPYRWCPCCKGLHINNGGKGHAEGCVKHDNAGE